jgi:hypothetical protein
MSKTIFLSHAGADSVAAASVARHLAGEGIDVRFDRAELRLGDSFLTFMEKALSTSDSCLLLWSRSAAATRWVRLEWESALHRSVVENRAFLVVARLEDAAMPALLAPRLWVDLFPEMEPGLCAIVGTWRGDRAAEDTTQRPVASLARLEGQGPTTIYIASEAFAFTVPLKVDLAEPAGICLDRVTRSLRLPQTTHFSGPFQVRFAYRLLCDARALDPAAPLEAQGVREKTVLGLETTMTPFAAAKPIAGRPRGAAYRGRESEPSGADRVPSTEAEALALAAKEYESAIARSGLSLSTNATES